jgi:GH35 family endo-1,4-beta-xylanase
MGFSHPQTIQIGGLRVVDLGAGVDPKSLPVTRTTYVGRDASAPWRAKAAERIEKHRKGDLAIRVLDAKGQPVPNATVSVQMTKPDFAFGSAVASDMIVQQSADGDRYRAWVKDNCSRVVIENHLKMEHWEKGLNPKTGVAWQNATTLKSLAWLKENGLEIKGHTLIWPSWRFSPKRLKDLAGDPVALKKAYDDHIVQILAATAPYDLVEWDVVNESFTQRDALDVLGDAVMTDWFKLARQHFPKGGLFYNDFGHLQSSRGNTTPFTQHIERVVKNLKDQGAPITGYGIQAHIGEGMPSPADVMEELDRLGTEFDLDLAITEFDLGVTDDQVHADYTRDFITACFASPRVRTFMAWGFWEGRHWIPRAAMIRKDWTERPATKVWNDLFKKEWWTNLKGTTDANGAWKGRGFRGLHEVKVTFKNPATGKLEERTAKVAIGETAQEVSVKLP